MNEYVVVVYALYFLHMFSALIVFCDNIPAMNEISL